MAKKKRTVKRVVPRTKKKPPKPMSPREKLFIREYMKDFNALRAAIRAGYAESSAGIQGHRLVKKYKAKIDAELAERNRRTDLSTDRVLREMALVALSNIFDYMEYSDDGMTVISSKELPYYLGAAISSVKYTPTKYGNQMEFKLHKKGRMLELLAQHLGLMDKEGNMKDRDAVLAQLDRMQNGDRDDITGIPASADAD